MRRKIDRSAPHDSQWGEMDAERSLLDYIEASEAPDEKSRPDTFQVIAACNELGTLYRSTGRCALSLDVFKKAEALARETLGTDCTEYAAILNNMAGTCRILKDQENAALLFRESLKAYERAGERESFAYASVLCNLSLTCREAGRLGEAAECLEKAAALIETQPEHRQETAIAYNNLTELYYLTGDTKKAHFCLNRSIQAFEKCPIEERAIYAKVLSSLAGYLYAEGDYEGAAALYNRSACYTRRFYGENADYGMAFQSLRWVYEKMGEKEKAAAALATAKRVYLSLFGPDHEKTRAVQDDLERLLQ